MTLITPPIDDRDRTSLVSDLMLERLLLDELPPHDARELAVKLASDGSLRGRVEALRRSTDTLSLLTVPELIRRIRSAPAAPPAARPPMFVRWAIPAVLAGVAAVGAFEATRRWPSITQAPPPVTAVAPDAHEDRAKGPALLALFRRAQHGSEALADGDVASRGDLIRVGYRVSEAQYGVIVSVDGRGTVTAHLPQSGKHAVALEPGRLVLLDLAYELDDAPRWERFYLVTSPDPFDVDAVIAAARRAVADGTGRAPEQLPLSAPLTQSGFLLKKETRQ